MPKKHKKKEVIFNDDLYYEYEYIENLIYMTDFIIYKDINKKDYKKMIKRLRNFVLRKKDD